MDKPRPEKVAVVAEVRDKLDAAETVVLTEYRGLNVRDLATLRKALGEAGGEYKVYKNTMVRFAAKDLDLDIEEMLVGPTAIAFTGTRPDGTPGDPVTIAKALTDFGKTNDKLVIKGGLLEGQVLTTEEITALSKIAPREELLARLAGGMAAPMQQFAALLNAIPAKFAYALRALIDEGGAPGAPESAPTADEPEVAAEEPAAEADEPEAEEAAAEAADASAESGDAADDDDDDAADSSDENADDAQAASEETESGEASDQEESGDASEEQES